MGEIPGNAGDELVPIAYLEPEVILPDNLRRVGEANVSQSKDGFRIFLSKRLQLIQFAKDAGPQ